MHHDTVHNNDSDYKLLFFKNHVYHRLYGSASSVLIATYDSYGSLV